MNNKLRAATNCGECPQQKLTAPTAPTVVFASIRRNLTSSRTSSLQSGKTNCYCDSNVGMAFKRYMIRFQIGDEVQVHSLMSSDWCGLRGVVVKTLDRQSDDGTA